MLGDIQRSVGHGPEQPVLTDPAFSSEGGQTLEVPSNLYYTATLSFCA